MGKKGRSIVLHRKEVCIIQSDSLCNSVHIIIIEPPAPRNVTVVRFDSTTIGISWVKFSLVELKGLASYVVTYDIIISSRKRQLSGSVTVPWTNNTVIISNLQAGAQYDVTVQTSTSAGMSGMQ